MFPSHVEFSHNSPMNQSYHEDFMTQINGNIFVYDEALMEVRQVGYIKATYFNVDKFWSTMNGDTCDLLNQDGDTNYFTGLYDYDSQDFTAKIKDRYEDDIFSGDFLALKILSIEKSARGTTIGLDAIRITIENYAWNAQIVCLQAMPLQFKGGRPESKGDDKFEVSGFSNDKETATKKLCEYYSKLGFWRFDDDGVMVLNRNVDFRERSK